MTRSHIRAIIDDGPRQGETLVLDVGGEDSPPREILLPDGHVGTRPEGSDVPHPTGSVSRYRLAETAEGTGFHYHVVPHGQ
jgi:hypothetical protein